MVTLDAPDRPPRRPGGHVGSAIVEVFQSEAWSLPILKDLDPRHPDRHDSPYSASAAHRDLRRPSNGSAQVAQAGRYDSSSSTSPWTR
jgi:hypothetical protein